MSKIFGLWLLLEMAGAMLYIYMVAIVLYEAFKYGLSKELMTESWPILVGLSVFDLLPITIAYFFELINH